MTSEVRVSGPAPLDGLSPHLARNERLYCAPAQHRPDRCMAGRPRSSSAPGGWRTEAWRLV